MIKLSNGHELRYCAASGALAFNGLGWLWEIPMVWLGLIKPELTTIFIKTLTLHPRKGNLRWWKPWECVKLIPGGSVNKVGLTNPGIEWWCKCVAPAIDFKKYSIAGSIYGDEEELVTMATRLNSFPLVALEINPSCPNTGHGMPTTEEVIKMVKSVKKVSRHPIIIKISVEQDYCAIADGLRGIAEGVSFNSVPWKIVYPSKRSPLWRLEKRIGGGGGGVSGKPAQRHNWEAVMALERQNALPVIAPSVMEYSDISFVTSILGAKAVSFGVIHLASYPVWLKPWTVFTNPLKPTQFIERRKKEGKEI